MKETFYVGGMHCEACVAKVEGAARAIPGVSAASVQLNKSALTLESVSPISPTLVAGAVRAAGTYTVLPGAPRSVFGTLRRAAPLFAMLLLVALFALVRNVPFSERALDWHSFMLDFMGGFFILFGGLKLVNVRRFAPMYRGYDVVAQRFPSWGYLYPLLEVGLGMLFFARAFLTFANVATVILMGVGMVGIYRKLMSEGEVQCACLGGFFNVPVTWITFAENGLMVAMALWMLLA